MNNKKKYLDITKNNIKKINKKSKETHPTKINYFLSQAKIETINNTWVTCFKKFPLVNPDFIYIDGPDQFDIGKNKQEFHTGHNDLMPISADLIRIEPYLIPGTLVIVDGRGANAEFLYNNFQRKWFITLIKNLTNIYFI